MARARNIKPGFFMNDDLAKIDPLGRLLFIGLWTIADRDGRLEDRPARIKVETLPYDNCDVDRLLDDLARFGFIIRYEVDGVRYIQVTNFAKHQNPHKNEKASEIPAPDLHRTSIVQAPDKDGAPSGVVWKSAQVEGEQKNKFAALAGEIQTQEKHHTSTVQVPEMHSTNRADSFNMNHESWIMNHDHPNPDTEPSDDDDDVPMSEVVQKFSELWGPPNSTHFDMINSYLEDRLTTWHILEALNRAAEANATHPNYIKAILQGWVKNKAYTPDAVRELDKVHERRQSASNRRAQSDAAEPRKTRYDPDEYREILREAGILKEVEPVETGTG